ncbi:MAG: hypothetical protein O2794_01440 [bacterium]|nr:hypothetical protein [bacterium]
MRRHSINTKYILLGVFLLFSALIVTTRVLAPLERFLLDGAASLLIGTDSLTSHLPEIQNNDSIRVVAKRSDEFRDILILNRAIPVGTPIVEGDILIGFIIFEGNSSSRMQIVSSPSYGVDGVFERSGIPARLEGRGAGILETRVPRGSDIIRGDTIYYDEERQLSIGSVARVEDVASNPFITLIITHPINVTTLTHVGL